MPKQTVVMPRTGWDAVAVILLEQARSLEREGRIDLLSELWVNIFPPIQAVVSAPVLDLITRAQDRLDPTIRTTHPGRAS